MLSLVLRLSSCWLVEKMSTFFPLNNIVGIVFLVYFNLIVSSSFDNLSQKSQLSQKHDKEIISKLKMGKNVQVLLFLLLGVSLKLVLAQGKLKVWFSRVL